ncbi:hypothetical protein [Luteitalea pratensis]|nr:hypothetical protein [Luteitalea pratensis]
MSRSLEIPGDAIVHTQDIPPDVNPLGGSWVWIKADAAIKQGPGLERLYARFLRGQIQQDFLAGGGAGVGAGTVGAPGGGAATSPLICPPQTVFTCPTRTAWCRPSVFTICPSQLTICATRQVICQVTAPVQCAPSLSFQCPTRICPSAVDACPSAPGGCWDPTIVQGTIVQQPGLGQVGLQGGFGFDPSGGMGFGPAGGGLVGAAAFATGWAACRTRVFPLCDPFTRTPLLCPV